MSLAPLGRMLTRLAIPAAGVGAGAIGLHSMMPANPLKNKITDPLNKAMQTPKQGPMFGPGPGKRQAMAPQQTIPGAPGVVMPNMANAPKMASIANLLRLARSGVQSLRQTPGVAPTHAESAVHHSVFGLAALRNKRPLAYQQAAAGLDVPGTGITALMKRPKDLLALETHSSHRPLQDVGSKLNKSAEGGCAQAMLMPAQVKNLQLQEKKKKQLKQADGMSMMEAQEGNPAIRALLVSMGLGAGVGGLGMAGAGLGAAAGAGAARSSGHSQGRGAILGAGGGAGAAMGGGAGLLSGALLGDKMGIPGIGAAVGGVGGALLGGRLGAGAARRLTGMPEQEEPKMAKVATPMLDRLRKAR